MGNPVIQKIELRTNNGDIFIHELQKSAPVLLIGSPISEYIPTLLPSGRSFSDALFDSLFYKDIFQPDPNSFGILKKLFMATPFEHLLDLCPSSESIENFILNLYNSDKTNPFHKIIVEAFAKGKISALITTNYDLCLDKELEQYNFSYKKVTSENEAVDCLRSNLPVYFKIHGSASGDTSDKPIFTLKREAYLPLGKKLLLEKLISGRKLILVAYSGLDFDICPTINHIQGVQIIWNTYTSEIPSTNANRLLENKQGIQLIGDMKFLFSDWIRPFNIVDRDWKKDEERKIVLLQKFLSTFSIEERKTWQISILNSIAVPSITLQALKTYSIPLLGSLEKKQKARALFHSGRYFDSARNYLAQAAFSFSKGNKYEIGDCLLEASDALRSAGSFVIQLCLLGLSWVLGDKFSHARVLLKFSLLIARIIEVLRMLKFNFLAILLIRGLRPLLIKCAIESVKSGNWFDYQQIGLISQDVGIPLSELEDATRYSPPDPRDGYEHLGYFLGKSMVILDQGRELIKNDLSRDMKEKQRDLILEEIEKCKRLGVYVITWKLYALLSHFVDEQDWDKKYQKEFHVYLNSCQYLPWGKMLHIWRYKIPRS
jgi:hypothetical protein